MRVPIKIAAILFKTHRMTYAFNSLEKFGGIYRGGARERMIWPENTRATRKFEGEKLTSVGCSSRYENALNDAKASVEEQNTQCLDESWCAFDDFSSCWSKPPLSNCFIHFVPKTVQISDNSLPFPADLNLLAAKDGATAWSNTATSRNFVIWRKNGKFITEVYHSSRGSVITRKSAWQFFPL